MSLILVVDDDERVRSDLTAHLEEQDHEVIVASNGQEGLQAAKNYAPDAIIVDNRMPVMDGIELLQRLREAKETYEVPIVMITDRETPTEKQKAQRYVVVDYIQKPVSKEDIQLRVKWALKAGNLIPATGWDKSGSEAARDDGSSGTEASSADRPAEALRQQYKAEPGESVREITPDSGGTASSHSGNVDVEIPPDSVPDTVGVMVRDSAHTSKPPAEAVRLRLGDRMTDVRVADQSGAVIAGLPLKSPARIGIKVDPRQMSQGGKNRVVRVQEFDPEADRWFDVATYVDENEGIAYTRRDRLGRAPAKKRGLVLVVETDEREFGKLYASLDGAGFHVKREVIPGKVKERIARDRPAIVILGMGVAGPAGARLLREIKFDPDIRNVTVIPVANPEEQDAYADAINVGAREVMRGPVRMGEVQFRVNRAFEAIAARRRRAAVRSVRRPAGRSPDRPAVPGDRPTPASRLRPAGRPAPPGQWEAIPGSSTAPARGAGRTRRSQAA